MQRRKVSFDLTVGIVRILDPSGATTGTGFVVTDDDLVATCAHVVEAAGAGPGDSVDIIFHSTGEVRQAKVETAWWCASDAEDVAILCIDGLPPEGVKPLLLGSSGGTSGGLGFPRCQSGRGHMGRWAHP